ncbi:hypothetical protein IF2G_10549 [Cordyceps javanica]|nr:hypothetical protein IF2G_10549 [Cordyceps javanica]
MCDHTCPPEVRAFLHLALETEAQSRLDATGGRQLVRGHKSYFCPGTQHRCQSFRHHQVSRYNQPIIPTNNCLGSPQKQVFDAKISSTPYYVPTHALPRSAAGLPGSRAAVRSGRDVHDARVGSSCCTHHLEPASQEKSFQGRKLIRKPKKKCPRVCVTRKGTVDVR